MNSKSRRPVHLGFFLDSGNVGFIGHGNIVTLQELGSPAALYFDTCQFGWVVWLQTCRYFFRRIVSSVKPHLQHFQ